MAPWRWMRFFLPSALTEWFPLAAVEQASGMQVTAVAGLLRPASSCAGVTPNRMVVRTQNRRRRATKLGSCGRFTCDKRHLSASEASPTIVTSSSPRRVQGQPGRRRNVGRIAESANHRWLGLTPIQFVWAVALRVIVAAIVGAVVYLATASVFWLIVALFATSVVISSVANSRRRA